jgi:hypothetical protein
MTSSQTNAPSIRHAYIAEFLAFCSPGVAALSPRDPGLFRPAPCFRRPSLPRLRRSLYSPGRRNMLSLRALGPFAVPPCLGCHHEERSDEGSACVFFGCPTLLHWGDEGSYLRVGLCRTPSRRRAGLSVAPGPSARQRFPRRLGCPPQSCHHEGWFCRRDLLLSFRVPHPLALPTLSPEGSLEGT